MNKMKKLVISNVTLDTPVILGTDGRRNRPAISCHLCGTGVRHGLHGNGKRKGSVL